MMKKTCSFNPLDPTSGNKNIIGSNNFDPLNCDAEFPNANQSLVSCDQNSGVKDMLENLAQQANNLYGLQLLYYRQDYNPKLAHPIYGDQNTGFIGPYLVTGYVKINSDTSLLTQFGIENTNEVDLQISYEEWAKVFGNVSPQAEDVFEIKDLLCERPSGFTKAIFKVTSQGDGDLFEASNRWFISAQRHDPTWLPNEPFEVIDDQVNSDEFIGVVDIDGNPIANQTQENPLERDIDDVASENLRNENDGVYGGFYRDGIYYDYDDL